MFSLIKQYFFGCYLGYYLIFGSITIIHLFKRKLLSRTFKDKTCKKNYFAYRKMFVFYKISINNAIVC